ncbi:DUF559 domain-containing protein [Actinomyces naeslundii]|nr:DUF559 domain-containing protein [Actinomyces naeslundii]
MLVMDTSALLTRISNAHGAARQVDLHLERSERRRLQALVDSGHLRRYPHGVVALPDVDKRVLIARVHRGLITCEHAAAHYRLPLPSSPKTLHVLIPLGHKAAPLWGEHQHETRDLPPVPLSAFPVAPLARCLADLLCCAQEWTALVAADAALHQGRVTYEQVGTYLRGSRRVLGRRRLQRTSSRARSPLETLARIQLRGAGLDVVDGVEIGGVGEVDLLIAGWLVVELDGYEYHSDMWSFDQDRSRDRELARLGYTSIRFTANNVRSGRIVDEVRRVLAAHPGAARVRMASRSA